MIPKFVQKKHLNRFVVNFFEMKYLQLITKQLFQNYPLNSGICRNAASRIAARFATTSSAQDRADMEELFLDQRVRYLLKRLTGYDPFKVFETQSISNLKAPKYRFLTDEQLAMVSTVFDIRFVDYLAFVGKENSRSESGKDSTDATSEVCEKV